ncbi:MAG: TetR/AcrR family transcriptional regulator [Firmicutes bacterium]|nr:TetR/AcrR family transcriptional regulator [Bacillota bacterium]
MKKEQKRRVILDSSLELFVRKGYAATTTRDIAQKADIAVGLLFYYFPTKEAVLEELINEATKGTEQVIPLFTQGLPPDKIFYSISSFITEMLNQKQGLAFFLLMSQTMALDCVSPHIREKCNKSEYVKASAEIIKAGQTQGLFKKNDALSLAYTFWGAIQGVAEMKYLYHDYIVPDGEVLYSILSRQPYGYERVLRNSD